MYLKLWTHYTRVPSWSLTYPSYAGNRHALLLECYCCILLSIVNGSICGPTRLCTQILIERGSEGSWWGTKSAASLLNELLLSGSPTVHLTQLFIIRALYGKSLRMVCGFLMICSDLLDFIIWLYSSTLRHHSSISCLCALVELRAMGSWHGYKGIIQV